MNLESLYQYLNNITPMAREAWDEFVPNLKERSYKKGDFFQQIGDNATNIEFIVEGSMRYFYIRQDGEEFNHAFRFEGDIAACYSSLIQGQPCFFSIQALTDTTTVGLSYKTFCQFTDKYPCFDRLEKLVTQRQFIGKEKRQHDFLTMSATERYLELLKEHPGIDKRVQQFHLASYIGIAPASLNRIIKSL